MASAQRHRMWLDGIASAPRIHDGLYVTYVFSQRWTAVEDKAGWFDECERTILA